MLRLKMTEIINQYSPILEGVDEKELKEQVLLKSKPHKSSS